MFKLFGLGRAKNQQPAPRPTTSLGLECLESREVPSVSASLAGGVLTVVGSDAADAITLRQTATTLQVRELATAFPLASVGRIDVKALGGDDVIDVRGVTKPGTIDGGSGADRNLVGLGTRMTVPGYQQVDRLEFPNPIQILKSGVGPNGVIYALTTGNTLFRKGVALYDRAGDFAAATDGTVYVLRTNDLAGYLYQWNPVAGSRLRADRVASVTAGQDGMVFLKRTADLTNYVTCIDATRTLVQYDRAKDFAVATDGTLYVLRTDDLAGNLYQWDPRKDPQNPSRLRVDAGNVESVVAGQDGMVFLGRKGDLAGYVTGIDAAGTLVQYGDVASFAVGSDGALWFAQNSDLYRWTLATGLLPWADRVASVTAGQDGVVFLGRNRDLAGYVTGIDSTGTVVQYDRVASFAVGSNGTLYVLRTDDLAGYLYQWGPRAASLLRMEGVSRVAASISGIVYVQVDTVAGREVMGINPTRTVVRYDRARDFAVGLDGTLYVLRTADLANHVYEWSPARLSRLRADRVESIAEGPGRVVYLQRNADLAGYVTAIDPAGTAAQYYGLNGFLTDGTLRVVGTNLPDRIALGWARGTVTGEGVQFFGLGGPVASIPGSAASHVILSAYGGDDVVDLGAVPLPATILGGAGNDTLIGGAGDDVFFGGLGSDILTGGDGADRFLIQPGDTVRDGTAEGVQLLFLSGDRAWSPVEILKVDEGFARLQARTGNTRLLSLPTNGALAMRCLQFERWANLGTNVLANNYGLGRIRIADLAFTTDQVNDSPVWATVIHEIGHNWDEASENGIADQFAGISGWVLNPINRTGLTQGADTDPNTPGVQNPWWYRNGGFVSDYAETNSKEDFAETLTAMFLSNTRYDSEDAPLKAAHMNGWLDSLRG